MTNIPIKINGYYMLSSSDNIEYNSAQLFVFYKNGIVRGGAYYSLDSLYKYQNSLNEYIHRGHKNKTHWGAYLIDEGRISIENWSPSSGGGMRTVIRIGEVINDTTFVIRKLKSYYNAGKEYPMQDTFRFHQYFPKPDSTNRFIK